MKRFGRIDPLIAGPQMLLAVIETQGLEQEPDLLDLSELADIGECSWYLAGEGRFIESRPSSSHVWVGDRWELDSDLDLQARAEAERAWRDQVMLPAFSLRDRHRDEIDLGIATTLSAEQFADLLSYVQLLRAWPQSPAFPDVQQRPIAPPWITEKTQ